MIFRGFIHDIALNDYSVARYTADNGNIIVQLEKGGELVPGTTVKEFKSDDELQEYLESIIPRNLMCTIGNARHLSLLIDDMKGTYHYDDCQSI